MKVLIATGLMAPEMGGPATYTKSLIDNLPQHNIEVDVLPFSVVRKQMKLIRHFSYFLKLLKLAKNSDIIIALDTVSVGFPAVMVSLFLHKKFILRVPGDYAWEQGVARFGITDTLDIFVEKKKKERFFVTLLVYIQKFVAKRASLVIVPSQYLKKIALIWGVKEKKIRVIYNAPPSVTTHDELLNTDPAELKRVLKLMDPVIISVGRLVKWKGFSTLIDLMPELIRKYPKIQLVIIGDGPLEEDIKYRVQIMRVEQNVLLLKTLTRERLYAYLRASNLFILNTNYEGLSHQILEAMSLKVPVVTTSVGGNTELIEDGISGVLVDYDNKAALIQAICQVLENNEYKEKIISAAKLKADSFTLTRMIDDVVKVFNEV